MFSVFICDWLFVNYVFLLHTILPVNIADGKMLHPFEDKIQDSMYTVDLRVHHVRERERERERESVEES